MLVEDSGNSAISLRDLSILFLFSGLLHESETVLFVEQTNLNPPKQYIAS